MRANTTQLNKTWNWSVHRYTVTFKMVERLNETTGWFRFCSIFTAIKSDSTANSILNESFNRKVCHQAYMYLDEKRFARALWVLLSMEMTPLVDHTNRRERVCVCAYSGLDFFPFVNLHIWYICTYTLLCKTHSIIRRFKMYSDA